MNILTIFCVVFILKVTEYTAGQRSGIFGSLLDGRPSRQPYKTHSRWPIQHFVYDRAQFVKRRLDRFRFFHKGIGKRSIDSRIIDSKPNNHGNQQSNIINEMKTLLKKMNGFQEQRPYDKQYLFATNPNLKLENTNMFRTLLGLNYLYNKRTPELFSENLYPIQAGKQQLEATLDKTLDRNREQFGTDVLDIVERRNNLEKNASVKSEMNNSLYDTMPTEVDTPFDLIFASPDLDNEYLKTDTKSEHEETNNASRSERYKSQDSKRWWAAKMFSKFRSPKSWNEGVKTATHVDPALYFIGLGK